MISIAGLSCEMFKVTCIKLTSLILSHRLLPISVLGKKFISQCRISNMNVLTLFLLRETRLSSACLVRKNLFNLKQARLGEV